MTSERSLLCIAGVAALAAIAGAVALDLVRTFPRQREVAPCSHCGQAVVLSLHQVGRADAGQPVYHADCTEPARRRWMRGGSGAGRR